MTFLYPKLLYLLLLLPLLLGWYIYRGRSKNYATLLLPSLKFFETSSGGWLVYARHMLFALRLLTLGLIIVALARPQSSRNWSESDVEGINVVLAMDISTSMLAMDFDPNRIEAAKRVVQDFVKHRATDNIGLVVFAGESFTACPLTTDHATLLNRLREMRTGIIEDRTAIGLGLVTAINRLKDSPVGSKVIVLLTDGVNNAGDISPKMAAELAVPYGIVVYTIGMGSADGEAPYALPSVFGSVVRSMPVVLDETTLQEVADITGGKYFRATDDESLEAIYSEIDKLEKTKLTTRHYRSKSEWFQLFALCALASLVLEFLLRRTFLMPHP